MRRMGRGLPEVRLARNRNSERRVSPIRRYSTRCARAVEMSFSSMCDWGSLGAPTAISTMRGKRRQQYLQLRRDEHHILDISARCPAVVSTNGAVSPSAAGSGRIQRGCEIEVRYAGWPARFRVEFRLRRRLPRSRAISRNSGQALRASSTTSGWTGRPLTLLAARRTTPMRLSN